MSKNESQRSSNKRSIIRMAQTTNGYTNDTLLADLETSLDVLEDYWTQFQAAQLAIETTCGPEAIDIQVIEMVDTERSFLSTKSKLKGFIKRFRDLEQQKRHHQGGGGPQGSGPQGGGRQGDGNPQSRLPKLDVPHFDGTYTAWIEFKDLFKTMVIDDANLTAARKLQYLKISLKSLQDPHNEAHDIISEYPVTDANFAIAWKALEDRYDNPRLIINSHLKVLFEQPAMTTESVKSLRLLLRTTQKCLRSLRLLGGPTDQWDWLLIHMIVVRLDPKTRRYWELTHTTKVMATWDQLVKALENRCNALESESSGDVVNKLEPKPTSVNKSFDRRKSQPNSSSKVLSSSVSSNTCTICGGTHVPMECKEFLAKNYDGRSELASKYSLCFKCLKPNHNFRSCNGKCQKCGRRHHVLLHNPNFVERKPEALSPSKVTPTVQEPAKNNMLVADSKSFVGLKPSPLQKQVLLSTALIKVRSAYGYWVIVRAFLDGGSQSCVITESCVKRLNLRKTSCDLPVSGIGDISAGTCQKEAKLELKSCMDSSFHLEIDVVIMKKISTDLPNRKFDISNWSYIKDLKLADPKFNEPGKIDILIGAEYYLSLMRNDEQICGPVGYPIAQSTVFGWILSGPVISSEESNVSKIFSVTTHVSLDKALRQFWEIEEIPNVSIKSLEDEKCEKHFEDSHYRDEEGRFVVKLPFNDEKLEFGESKSIAFKRFTYLERRFAKDETLYQDYVGVIKELQALNHMTHAEKCEDNDQYYLPHHPVIKPFRLTTKTRVVMDASAKSSNGVSLNDRLRTGPRLQQDLLRIILRFRSFRIVVCADIEKMFRQVSVNQEDHRYQKILWRKKPEDSIQEFQLTTVTFGTSSAPFLAVKSLQTLAQKEGDTFPKAKMVILEDFYMDDLLTGGDHPEEVISLVQDLQTILNSGKFPLRKWISNDDDVIQSIDKKVRAVDDVWNIPVEQSWKALGLRWHPGSDQYDYKINVCSKGVAITKRSIMAVIASLYDPLGLLAPTTIVAKIFLQKLWMLKVDWDEQLNGEMRDHWIKFQSNLIKLENIKVFRWIGSYSYQELELHGFSDAADLAYSAVIYARTLDEDGNYSINIVIAKTKVAPIKTLSTPKLELCGAVLLTRLMKYVTDSLRLDKISMFTWCDNTAVLDWLKKDPITWKTFVANRVSEIQTTLPLVHWRYVSSEDNPADCATRGVDSSDLKDHQLWWNGPSWLKLEESSWPTLIPPTNSEAKMEARKSVVMSSSAVVINDVLDKLATKFSSLNKLKRVTAYVLRFVGKGNGKRQIGEPNVLELDNALRFWLKFAQDKAFKNTLVRLEKGKQLLTTDSLLSLNPFIGDDGLLRVGGRLQESSLDYDQKHQIILPQKDPITNLIIADIHESNFHGGTQLMFNDLRRKYWLIAARRSISQFIRNCVRCCRVKGRTSNQIMGNLPASRVTIGRPFLKSGVDYAGPIEVRVPTANKRKFFIVKGYVAVFVCMSTKSIHLEVVSDQTTEAFLAAFKRFIARRGKCRELRSDQGSNFVGAKAELKELFEMLQNQVKNGVIKKTLSEYGTDWFLHPPGAPHFSGLFEAAVKSAKHHIRRILKVTPFTFEEWTTILCQIEAILNSRPLIALSDDVNDLEVLTPGHFLIGEPLTAIPEPNLEDIRLNLLNRYQLMQRKVQEFWRNWQSDYLSTLQQRTKWKSPVDNLKIGQIVTIKDEDMPTTKWLMGRILNVFPGKDSHVRVAKIKKANGELTKKEVDKLKLLGFNVDSTGTARLKTVCGTLERPIHKLCVLPADED